MAISAIWKRRIGRFATRGKRAGGIVRRVTIRVFGVFGVVLAAMAARADAARADVIAAYELTDPAVVPGGGVVAVTPGGPDQPLVITLDNTPGEHTIKVQFVADVDVATPLVAYAIEWSTSSGTVEVTDFSYLGPFEFDLVVPPDLILAAGPGTILDEAAQVTFRTPQSGILELFEATLVVSVPTDEIQIFSRVGESEWASSAPDFSIYIADSEPLPGYWTGDDTSTPSIIIQSYVAPPVDCNTNSIPDSDEIDHQPGLDCDSDGALDSCQIAAQASLDCNTNGVPDSCEIASQPGLDCDTNGAIDRCEIAAQPGVDCNSNGALDRCEIANGAADCNSNGVPDSCEIAAGAADCNGNAILDSCELKAGAADCDMNGVLDACELAAAPGDDCDWNGVPDRCEIAGGAVADCNSNGRPDGCDVAGSVSADINANGVPDECESTAASQQQQPDDGSGAPTHVVDRRSLRSYLAFLFGIPWEGGLTLSGLSAAYLGPLGIPVSIFFGGLELLGLPDRTLLFHITYAILDALLP